MSVWNDSWLPRDMDYMVRNMCLLGLKLIVVGDLMMEDYGEWNSDIVKGIFYEEEVELILSIQLSYHCQSDKLIWAPSIDGHYSMKSAYNLFMSTDKDISFYDCLCWKQIWSASVPPKVKSFIWHLLTNSLPIQRRLQEKGMDITAKCPCCDNTKTLFHVFFFIVIRLLRVCKSWVFLIYSWHLRMLFTEFGFIVEDCKMMLKKIPNIYIRWVNKQNNKVTHHLTRASCDHRIFYVWESTLIDISILLNV